MTSQSTITTHSKRFAYFVTGGIGLLLSAVYLLLSREYTFGNLSEPGARVWPTIVGLMLITSSFFVLWEAWHMPASEVFELPAGADLRRVLAMIGLLALYLIGMQFVGNLIAAAVFCLLFMRLVSPLSWPKLAIASVCIAVGLHALFVIVLKIPMPVGPLGF